MERISQKISYIKGLADGLDLKESSKEGKVLSEIIDVLEGLVDVVDETIVGQIELDEYVTLIDEDLSDMEDDFYGYEDECCGFDFDEDFEFIEDSCEDEGCCCGDFEEEF